MKNKHRWSARRLSDRRGAASCRWLGVVAFSVVPLACGSSEVDSPAGSAPPPFSTGGTGAGVPSGVPPVGMPAVPVGPVGAAGQSNAGAGGTGEGNVTPVGIDGMAGTSSGSSSGGAGSTPAPSAGGTGPDTGDGGQGGTETGEDDGDDDDGDVGEGGTDGEDDDGDNDGEDDGDDDEPVGTAGTGNVPTPPTPTPPAPTPGDCNNPPPPSRLEGWAAVAGNGVNTTTGGGNAPMQVVTNLAQLQAAVAGTNAAVIGVRGNMAPGDVRIGSNKTIVGLCGAQIHGHVEINGSTNVIVRNIEIVGFSPGNCALDPGFDASVGCSSGDDAVIIQRNSHHVWFDHCIVRDGTDGNLDISNGANFVTISFTKFMYTPRTDNVGSDSTGAAGHRYSNLVGGTDEPDDFDDANSLNVTWHHNWWADNVVERQPRIRFGQNHLYNNYWNSDTANYCVRAGIESNILLEGNVFDGVDDPHEFNNADDQGTANITANNTNVYINTTSDMATGGGGQPFTNPPYQYVLDNANAIAAAVQNPDTGAGPH
jgi:pectate lyase